MTALGNEERIQLIKDRKALLDAAANGEPVNGDGHELTNGHVERLTEPTEQIPGLTLRQSEIMDFIRRHLNGHGVLPTAFYMAKRFEMRDQSMRGHIDRLIARGFLVRVGKCGYALPEASEKRCRRCGQVIQGKP